MMKLNDKYEELWFGNPKSEISEALLQFLYEFLVIIDRNFSAPLQLQVACESGIEKLLSTKGNFYVDCYDIKNSLRILTDYMSTRTDAERLRIWIREFLKSSSEESALC